MSAVFSIFTDLICTSLPVIILWNIRINFKQKVAICGLMGLGLLYVTSALRKNPLTIPPLLARLFARLSAW